MPSALVTGASSGIGQAVAADLAGAGWDVTAVARNPARGAPADTHHVAADLSVEEGCVRAVAAHRERVGGLDLLVSCAGLNLPGLIAESPVEVWDDQFAVNARAPFLLAREAAPLLVAAKGLVVVISSILGVEGGATMNAYAASKHAVLGITRSLNAELNGRGVRATAICPAFVATPMVEWADVPADEMIQPADIVRAVRFLCDLTPVCVIEELVIRRTGFVQT